MEMELEGGERKIFFINEDFTFETLKEMIEFESPSTTVECNFSRSGSQLMDDNSNVQKFIYS